MTEATGHRAYTLYSEAALRELGLNGKTQGFLPHAEAYEHLGTVETWIEDMHPIWASKRDAMQVKIEPNGELFRIEIDIGAPPETVWDYFIQPEHFKVVLGADRTKVERRSGGRVAMGSVYQCYHGDAVIMNTVVGWYPFERLVFEVVLPVPFAGTTALAEFRLEPKGSGTRLIEIFGRASGPLLGRIAGDAGTKSREKTLRAQQAEFKALIEAGQLARRSAALPRQPFPTLKSAPQPAPVSSAAELFGAGR